MIHSLVFSGGMLFASPASAASLPDPVTLASLWQSVREANPELRSAARSAESAGSQAAASGYPDDPMLGVGVWQVPVAGNFVQGMLEYSENIPNPLRLYAHARMQSEAALAERARSDAVLRRLYAETRAALAEYARADRTLATDREDTRAAQELSRSVSVRYAAGQAAYAELLSAQEEALTLENELLDVELARDRSAAALNALMNRAPGEMIPSPARENLEVREPAESLGALQAQALEHRPEAASALATERGAAAAHTMALASYLPDLNVRAAYMPIVQGAGVDMWQAGVGITLPVFGWSRLHEEAAAAETSRQGATAAAESTRNQIRREVFDAYLRVRQAARHVGLHHDRLVPLSERAVQAALASYAAGRTTFSAVLEAVRAVHRHHREELGYRAEYEAALAALDQAVGVEPPHAEEHHDPN